jgi:hypothetical protein
LTTFIIFLQSFVDFFKTLPENKQKRDEAVYISETLNIPALQSKYLFMVKPNGRPFPHLQIRLHGGRSELSVSALQNP